MRWFILVLILANVSLFFWLQYDELPEDPVLALPPPDIGRLELMRDAEAPDIAADGGLSGTADAADPVPEAIELETPPDGDTEPDEDASEKVAETVADVTVSPSQDTTWNGPTPTGQEVPGEPSVMETELLPPEGVPGQEADTPEAPVTAESSTVDAVEAGLPGSTETPPPVIASAETQPLVGQDIDSADTVRVQVAELESPPPAVATCARVGPLNGDAADGLLASLPVFIVLLSDVTEEMVDVTSYFVMIPPLASRSEGLAVLERLEAAGVTDTWLFPDGRYRNAVSLGLFKRQAGAQRRQRQVAEKGFNVEVVERGRRREVRRLLLKNVDGGDIGLSLPLPEGAVAEPQACP